MKKKVTDIFNVPYGEGTTCCEPSKDEINAAIQKKELEPRSFQGDIAELLTEFNEQATGDFQEYCHLVRQYHANRIAFFVVNGWNDPIIVKKDGKMISDGLHRLKAAIHMGINEIDFEFEPTSD